MKETNEEKIAFYLDPTEFLNKPRRVYMGLQYKLEDEDSQLELSGFKDPAKCKKLIIEIIKEAEADFYKYTFPKFDKRVREIWSNE
jgi:hypothetical protein